LEEDFENQDPFLFLTNGIIPKSETHSRYLRIIQNFIFEKGPDLKLTSWFEQCFEHVFTTFKADSTHPQFNS
jgi:hypothetical protein